MQLCQRLLSLLFVIGLVLALAFHAFVPGTTSPAVAQEANSIQAPYIERLRQITFSTMPPTTESGSVNIPGVATISWQPGQTPDQFLRLGTFYDAFDLQLFSMEQIAELASLDVTSLSLADISLIQSQTLREVVAAIPDLGNWQVYQLPVIQDLLAQSLGDGPWDEISLRNLIGLERFGNLTLTSLDLSQYGLDAIPGLLQTPLGRFQGWEQAFINEIPGLNHVPFAAFPGIPTGPGYVALLDLPYGQKEARRTNTITGSDVEGFNVPCNQNSCSYIELSGPSGLGAAALHGKQWIKGGSSPDAQMVRGGHGAMSAVNGGKEPTGRHPYGPAFKVVLTKTVESEGRAEFALYFRYCNALGCTPYFIGPIPWFANHEEDILFVGLTITSSPPPGVPHPPTVPPPQVEPGPIVDPGRNAVNEDCLTELLRAIPASMQSIAQQSIPLILASARRSGVNDTRQLAYILATVAHESGWGQLMSELSSGDQYEGRTDLGNTHPGDGRRFQGRGYVPIIGRANYQYWSDRLGKLFHI